MKLKIGGENFFVQLFHYSGNMHGVELSVWTIYTQSSKPERNNKQSWTLKWGTQSLWYFFFLFCKLTSSFTEAYINVNHIKVFLIGTLDMFSFNIYCTLFSSVQNFCSQSNFQCVHVCNLEWKAGFGYCKNFLYEFRKMQHKRTTTCYESKY